MLSLRASSFITGIMATPAVVAISQASAAAVTDLSVVALTGQQAAGTPPGTSFSLFGPAAFDGAPGIGADSTIGFAAILSDGTRGFWLDNGSGLQLLARSGAPAPGTEPGVVFKQKISEIFIFTPPFLVPGHAVLFNTVSGPGVGFNNDEGIWSSSGSGLVLVTREGVPAPGLPSVQLTTLSLRAVDNAGRAMFDSVLAGAVSESNNVSIWRSAPDSGLELLAREGDAAPGVGPGVVLAVPPGPVAFPIIIGNAAGDLLFGANLVGPGTSFANDEALFIRDAAGTHLFLRKGDPVPGLAGFAFSTDGSNGDNISLSDNGDVAIIAGITDGAGSGSALLSNSAGSLGVLVRSGDAAPGASGPLALLVRPVMNVHGDVAFLASDTSHPARLGLWVHTAGGLRAVALPDQQVPGQPGTLTLHNVQILNAFNDDGFLLFTAVLDAPGGQQSTALLLADPAGATSILARSGAAIEVADGDLRTVSEVISRLGALSSDSQIAFGVRFTDGSGAEIRAVAASACPADLDGNGSVGVSDFLALLNAWGPCANDCPADLDGNGSVGAADFLALLAAWGPCG